MPGYEITITDPTTIPATVKTYSSGYDLSTHPGFSIGNPPLDAIATAGYTVDITQDVGAQNMLLSWYPTAVSNNGFPLMVANFTGVEQAHTVGAPYGMNHLVEMDFGIKASDPENPWNNMGVSLGAPRKVTDGVSSGGPYAPDGIPNPYDSNTWAWSGGLANISGKPVFLADRTRTVGQATSDTQLSRQNGYTFGNMMDTYFDQQGIMYGIYSNGITLPLYQVVLFDFYAPQGLRFEGGNLVSQTMESGEATGRAAGVNGMGTVNGYMIEQSNVDLAQEIVHMITTQRGYQANSKTITTVDTMLEVTVNMKR
jgi:flagellar hook protein FlgE